MKLWLKSEIKWCALDQKPEGSDINHSVYRARSVDKNFRQAEALLQEFQTRESVDPLQVAKVLLSRGHLEKAQEVLDQAHLSSEAQSVEFWEVVFEQSRLFAFQGRWEQAVEFTSAIIASSPVGVTVMGAYQTRAVAYVEMGEFKLALRDVEKVIGMGTLYPAAFSLFYAEVQKARLLFLEGQIGASERLRQNLWHQATQEEKLNLDQILTLSRLNLFSSLQLHPTELISLLRAQWTTADIMGDDLYRALSEAYAFIMRLKKEISPGSSEFERIKDLIVGQSTEKKQLFGLTQSLNQRSTPLLSELQPVRLIYLEATKKLLDLFTRKIHSISKNHHSILSLFKDSEKITVESVFQNVTQMQFKAHLHSNYISNLIYQLNRKCPKGFKISDGFVIAENCVVINS